MKTYLLKLLWGGLNKMMYVKCLPHMKGFSGGSDGKEFACSSGDLGLRPGFDPCIGKIPWRSKWQPTPVFLPWELQGQKSLACYSLMSIQLSLTGFPLTFIPMIPSASLHIALPLSRFHVFPFLSFTPSYYWSTTFNIFPKRLYKVIILLKQLNYS